jgi:hypothetical protein
VSRKQIGNLYVHFLSYLDLIEISGTYGSERGQFREGLGRPVGNVVGRLARRKLQQMQRTPIMRLSLQWLRALWRHS